MELNPIPLNVANTITYLGLKIIAAFVLYLAGRWLINLVLRLMQRVAFRDEPQSQTALALSAAERNRLSQ